MGFTAHANVNKIPAAYQFYIYTGQKERSRSLAERLRIFSIEFEGASNSYAYIQVSLYGACRFRHTRSSSAIVVRIQIKLKELGVSARLRNLHFPQRRRLSSLKVIAIVGTCRS